VLKKFSKIHLFIDKNAYTNAIVMPKAAAYPAMTLATGPYIPTAAHTHATTSAEITADLTNLRVSEFIVLLLVQKFPKTYYTIEAETDYRRSTISTYSRFSSSSMRRLH